jgi:CheY-like chemotaxis protein
MTTQLPSDLFRGWRVLLVDDEDDSLGVAQYLFEFYGAEIYTAVNGQEGLTQARQHRPDFIISDLSMPQVDGWNMLKQLRQDAALSQIPIIALTAHALRGDRERVLEAGFDNYLTKPLNVTTFIWDLLQTLRAISALSHRLPSNLGDAPTRQEE